MCGAERTFSEPVAETENGGWAGSLRENGRRTDLAFFGRAVGALVHGYLAPVKAVPFVRVAVAGKTIAGHRVGRGTSAATSPRPGAGLSTMASPPSLSSRHWRTRALKATMRTSITCLATLSWHPSGAYCSLYVSGTGSSTSTSRCRRQLGTLDEGVVVAHGFQGHDPDPGIGLATGLLDDFQQ